MKVNVHMTWYDSESVELPDGVSMDDTSYINDLVDDIVANSAGVDQFGEPAEVEWEIEDD
jgi:hypothetical protein